MVEDNNPEGYAKHDIIIHSQSQGLQRGLRLASRNIAKHNEKKVTTKQYYSYKLHFQKPLSLLFFSGRLFQQYVVDNYVKIESTRLNYLRFNQNKICQEIYQGLQDSLQSEIVKTSNDAMALVQTYGKPDLFITITCNPWWDKIKSELLQRQTLQDRPDLIGKNNL
ncbi:28401_t:CDS:2 [Dentiscutata erythropus]|uniref:28401_t:CDS:1 n=1 Tax=Dentiscutata erythropus TaxID=1348616 RepID=A0A9N9CVU3_9GLOM|nr:28401_t:CDS:2 [Dentiscutata erythropus]